MYHEPRPYMRNSDILVLGGGCSSSYGHPSGHSLTSAAATFTLLWDMLKMYSESSIWLRVLAICLSPIIPFIVGFSRLFNGVHSLDQIILGWILGIWLSCFCHFYIRPLFIPHIKDLLSNVKSYESYKMLIL